jgi:hypothetical protein
VALTVAFLLIPTAALAVDLGTVYVRTSGLQDAADAAARSAATELARRQNAGVQPAQAMAAARTAAVDVLCADQSLAAYWQTPCSQRGWVSDGDPANGEVAFYSGTPSAADHVYTADQAATGSALASGVRVLTPPSHVTYGLAGAFGQDSTDLQKAATATLRTVLPRYGFLPLFAISSDAGTICIRSAPKTSFLNSSTSLWSLRPDGACGPEDATHTSNTARGYLAVPNSHSGNAETALGWNTALGIQPDRIPYIGSTVALASQQNKDDPARLRRMVPAFFAGSGYDGPGRLARTSCPGGNTTSIPGYGNLQGAHLDRFVNTRVGGTLDFQAQVLSGTSASPAQTGWLTPDILRCGRLALIPEITVGLPLPAGGLPSNAQYQVTGWRLMWIDNEFSEGGPKIASAPNCLTRGFYYQDANDPLHPNDCATSPLAVRAITGYLLDPGLLPPVVHGEDAANTIDYRYTDMPATVRLIRDVDDPPAG